MIALITAIALGLWALAARGRQQADDAASDLVALAEEQWPGIEAEPLSPPALFEALVARGFDPDPLVGTLDDFEFETEIRRLLVRRCVLIEVKAGVVDSQIRNGGC